MLAGRDYDYFSILFEIKVKPVESCGNEAESLECTSVLTTTTTTKLTTKTKPFATRNKPTPERLVLAPQGSQGPRGSDAVDRNEAEPKPLLHELNPPHRSGYNSYFLSEPFSTSHSI